MRSPRDHPSFGRDQPLTALTRANLDEPITRHMHQDYTRLSPQQTVGQALQWLRDHPPPGRIIYFYVVDDADRLCGVVPIRRLVLSQPDRPLREIMVERVITLPAAATVLEACEFFIQHRLLAFPVVDADRRMLGIVDVELYTGELTELSEAAQREDLFQRIGVRLARPTSALTAFRTRFPWLGANLFAGITAALLAGVFEGVLSRFVALAFFIPVVLNLAESVSSQSVSLTLQFLHGQPPTWRWLLAQVRAELATGALLGLASGAAMALVALAWLGQPRVAWCLLGGIAGGVTGAAVLGIVLPVVLRLLHLEPRVAAGPVALAGADIITILIYLSLAQGLLG
jgi:magnesium transporter